MKPTPGLRKALGAGRYWELPSHRHQFLLGSCEKHFVEICDSDDLLKRGASDGCLRLQIEAWSVASDSFGAKT